MCVHLWLGLIFTVFGLNGFIHFLPTPPMESLIGEMMGMYIQMDYMFPLIFATPLARGVLLLTNRYVALALVLLAPVIVNIVCVHLYIEPSGIPVALVVLACALFLAYAYRQKYAPLLRPKYPARPRIGMHPWYQLTIPETGLGKSPTVQHSLLRVHPVPGR